MTEPVRSPAIRSGLSRRIALDLPSAFFAAESDFGAVVLSDFFTSAAGVAAGDEALVEVAASEFAGILASAGTFDPDGAAGSEDVVLFCSAGAVAAGAAGSTLFGNKMPAIDAFSSVAVKPTNRA